MRKLNCSQYTIMTTCLIAWVGLFFAQLFIIKNPVKISNFCETLELILHIFMLILVFKIYKKADSEDKKIFKWFGIANIFLFLNDVWFYFIIFYIPNDIVKILSLDHFLFNFIFTITWMVAIIIFFSELLIKYTMQPRLLIKIMLTFFSINVIIVALFSIPINYTFGILYWQNILMLINFIIELIIFSLAILCLIYSRSQGISLIGIGFIVLISGDFLLAYCYVTKEQNLLGYGDLLWILGLLFMLFGMLSLTIQKSEPKHWLRTNTSIKSKLIFWSFNLSFISFLTFFAIAYFCNIIKNDALLGLPIFIMVYSIVVVILSTFMGKAFEMPFKKMENSIEALIINNDKTKLTHDFTIDEFVKLQQFFMNAYESKEEKDKMVMAFGEMATTMAHDVGSPLCIMTHVIQNLKKQTINTEDLDLLERAVKRVKNITHGLLINFRNMDSTPNRAHITDTNEDDANQPRFIIFSTLLKQIINDKEKEWSGEPCDIFYEADDFCKTSWAYLSPLQMSRTLSNLLNNAYESLKKNKRNIKICLTCNASGFNLTIQDSGTGIPHDKINSVMSGMSLKHSGQGLGLSTAINYFNSLSGYLTLESKLNESTKLNIAFPIATPPKWYPNSIPYNEKSCFVILDDDLSIITFWQSLLKSIKSQSKYFTKVTEFESWFINNNQNNNIILFTDYNLHDPYFNGVGIILKYGMKYSYLMTSDAETAWMQTLVNNCSIKLIPKSLLGNIQFTYDENL